MAVPLIVLLYATHAVVMTLFSFLFEEVRILLGLFQIVMRYYLPKVVKSKYVSPWLNLKVMCLLAIYALYGLNSTLTFIWNALKFVTIGIEILKLKFNLSSRGQSAQNCSSWLYLGMLVLAYMYLAPTVAAMQNDENVYDQRNDEVMNAVDALIVLRGVQGGMRAGGAQQQFEENAEEKGGVENDETVGIDQGRIDRLHTEFVSAMELADAKCEI